MDTKKLTTKEKKNLILSEIAEFTKGNRARPWMSCISFTVSELYHYCKIPFSKSTIRKYLYQLLENNLIQRFGSDAFCLTAKGKDLSGIDYKKNYCPACGLELGQKKEHWHTLSCLPDVNKAFRMFITNLIWDEKFFQDFSKLRRQLKYNQDIKAYNPTELAHIAREIFAMAKL